jgi:hypothetical protein
MNAPWLYPAAKSSTRTLHGCVPSGPTDTIALS